MSNLIQVSPKIKPPLDPDFIPAALWNRAYRSAVKEGDQKRKLVITLERKDGSVSVFETEILPHESNMIAINEFFADRLVKFLLWQKGGYKITIAGDLGIAAFLEKVYSPTGKRSFDYRFMGEQVYGLPMVVEQVTPDDRPEPKETTARLGRHLDGCRIGFDLGGSDRKCAAVVDGKVVHTEEVAWDPYFKTDPQWHFDEMNDSLRRAAEKLPRVDAIGGSAAGVYVNNEVRVASLFRGVPQHLFESRVRGIFFELREAWGGVPLVVVNDGEVTALAGSMSLNDNAVLGLAMGTSLAAGYVDAQGNISNWLNELAFAPVDYRANAPVDEWSGDRGCGAQYFSQQAVGRLIPAAGIDLPSEMPLPETLVEVQRLVQAGDERAAKIYQSIGVYLGYSVAHFADFYNVRNILVLGRVMTGAGGDLILATASHVLNEEFPESHKAISIKTLDEKDKRLGQAVVAASLPPP